MIDFLLGVPGKLKTLTDRITAARAGYLDNLSAGAVAQASDLATLTTNVADTGRMRSQVFTTSGTFTPDANVSAVFVRLVGGGGTGRGYSSAKSGGGGGAGEMHEGWVPVSGAVTVTVAAAKAGVVNGSAAGDPTSFGSLSVAGGGAPASGNVTGGSGGGVLGALTAGAAKWVMSRLGGGRGGDGNNTTLPGVAGDPSARYPGGVGGSAGSSAGGGGGAAGYGGPGGAGIGGDTDADGTSAAADAYGAGGGGVSKAATTGKKGGAGGPGLVEVYWIA